MSVLSLSIYISLYTLSPLVHHALTLTKILPLNLACEKKNVAGKWFEYGEIKRMNGDLRREPWRIHDAGDRCNRCIHACQGKHLKASEAWSWQPKASSTTTTPQVHYPPPPAVDLCIFQECGAKALCPSIVHDMKTIWSQYKPYSGWPEDEDPRDTR